MPEQPPTDAELRSYDEARLAATMRGHQANARTLRQELSREEARFGPGVDIGARENRLVELRAELAAEEERIEWLHRALERKKALT